ncbi:MAG: hypothetical protein HZA51_03950 [Planctomycetes bacterium]|nr:hypothetical protein [Planctomycetota bacterium]
MAHRLTTSIDALAAPSTDGELVIWPAAGSLPAMVEANRKALSACDAMILGRPIRAWRQPCVCEAPTIMTGHQPAFFHAGVWIKNAAAFDLAKRVGGAARFLAVDSDQSHGVELQHPAIRDGFVSVDARTGFPALRESAFEQLPDQTDAWWREFLSNIGGIGDDSRWSHFSKEFAGESAAMEGYAARWVRGIGTIDRAFGVSLDYAPISRTFGECPSAHAFAAHLLLEAARFASAYNESLGDYRERRGIRGRAHPIPDLAVHGDRIELPFWLLRGATARRRLFVSMQGTALHVFAEDTAVGSLDRSQAPADPSQAIIAALGEWRLRPRALALTLHARLLACDLFIHGIGGAKYDQITDGIIRRFFNVEPPAYACASATLRLELPRFGIELKHLAIEHQRRRDIQWNPHRVVPSPDKALVAEWTAAVAEANHLRERDADNHAARSAAFERIRRANKAFGLDEARLSREARDRIVQTENKIASDRVANSREWFVGLHPSRRITELRDRVARTVA